MNFTEDDIHRSLRRHVSLILTEPWRVRTERQPVTPDEREVCVIEPASGVTTGPRRRTSVPQGNVEKLQAYSIMAYPAKGETARESRAEAQAIATLLDQTFTNGLVDESDGVLKDIGGPFILPVYDFEGVPVSGKSRAGPTEPYGFARIDDLSVRKLQDTADPLLFTVACDLRLGWEQGGRIAPPAPIASEMPGGFTPP